jgi:alpha-tubulin suppressor-like RCC1 family protein
VSVGILLLSGVLGSHDAQSPTGRGPVRADPDAGGGAALVPVASTGGPIVSAAVHHDVSARLALIPDTRTPGRREDEGEEAASEAGDPDAPTRKGEDQSEEEARERSVPKLRQVPVARDTVLQTTMTAANVAVSAIPAASRSWEGVSAWYSAPPDTSMDVSPTQVVEVVNSRFAVYDKTSGALLYGPVSLNTLFSGFGGLCQTTNDGDPTVQWDRLAGRWVISQFAISGANGSTVPYLQCVAVSTTGSALGSWYRYSFAYSFFNDYPKLAVWPDAYYTTFNAFNPYFDAAYVCAYDRLKMVAGLPATQVCFREASYAGYSILVAGVDGSGVPDASTAAYATAFETTTSLAVWRFRPDWNDPTRSTWTRQGSIAVAGFSQACTGGRSCIQQPDTSAGIDGMGDRMLYRLVYRRIGSTESILASHAAGSTTVGVRWYELRPSGSTLAVYQQGTYQPDATNRWMSSIAMDEAGGIALGYNASSATVYPSIRYAARIASDPLGTLGQGEATLIAGTGSQIATSNRWGDYSAIALDPEDGCTFWIAGEYIAATGSFNWRTRIGSFTQSNCAGINLTPRASIAAPGSLTTASTSSFSVLFSRTVTGLTSGDFTLSGTATGCTVGEPTGSGTPFQVPVTDCSDGTLTLTLAAGSVTDASGNTGPAAPAVSSSLRIDRTPPVLASPVLSATSAARGTPITVTASATDGSGVGPIELRIDASAWTSMRPARGSSGATTQRATVQINGGPSGVAVGWYHACAVLSGPVACWGDDFYGQLGDGSPSVTPVPGVGSLVVDITAATAIVAGGRHSCALSADGTVRCWGDNNLGQLGDGSYTSSATPVQVSGILTARAISAGWYHTCALLADQTVRCWGNNGFGQLGNASTSTSSTPVVVSSLSGATAVVAAGYHSCALLTGGAVRCWGSNQNGQLGDGTLTTRTSPVAVSGLSSGATALGAGGSHSCAVVAGGTVRCWGYNGSGQLGDGTLTTRTTPVTVSGLGGAVALGALGESHTCAAISDGTARCWGSNASGQLGNGIPNDSATPVTVSGLAGLTALALNGSSSCASLEDGTVRCWGMNDYGKLGDGTFDVATAPVRVVAIPEPLALGSHTVCLRATDVLANVSTASVCAGFTVGIRPTVTLQPANVTASAGDAVSFRSTATGTPAPSIAWQVSADGGSTWSPIPDATSETYAFNATAGDGGRRYRAAFASEMGSATSAAATLTVNLPPAVTLQPANRSVGAGTTASFTAAASGTPAPTVRWQRSLDLGTTWSEITGATSATYAFTATTGDSGRRFRAVFANALGAAISDAATLTVLNPPVVSTFTPTSGGVGTAVTVTGRGFTGATACRIGTATTSIACYAVSDGTLILGIPAGAATGPLTVVSVEGSGGSATNFSVGRSAALPTISGFTPPAGTSGDLVTINGSNVGAATAVAFAGRPVTSITALSASSIRVRVPAGATTGTISLTTGGGAVTSAATFIVYAPPVISSVAPLSGAPGTAVTIRGSNFGGASAIGFGGVETTAFTATATTITLLVPRDATSGAVTVRNPVATTTGDVFAVTRLTAPALVAGGTAHSCATFVDGSLRCWGSNANGQLGDGSTATRIAPVAVAGLGGVPVSLTAGGAFSCVALTDGTARCWGLNTNGQLGNATTTQSLVPVVVRAVGGATGSSLRQVVAGTSHACAALTDGTARCWGLNSLGQLGDGTSTQRTSPVTVLAAAGVTLQGVVALSAGGNTTCAAITDGTLRCWGANANGQLGNGATSTKATSYPGVVRAVGGASGSSLVRVRAVAVGTSHVCAALTDGTGVCWGLNTNGQLGDGSVTQRTSPVVVGGLTAINGIAVGASHSCVSRTDGTVRCWGLASSGQLGTNSTTQATTPATPTGGIAVAGSTGLACGGSHTLVVLPALVASWGANGSGQLGDATTTNRLVPTGVIGF